jgi:hypothetical protein
LEHRSAESGKRATRAAVRTPTFLRYLAPARVAHTEGRDEADVEAGLAHFTLRRREARRRDPAAAGMRAVGEDRPGEAAYEGARDKRRRGKPRTTTPSAAARVVDDAECDTGRRRNLLNAVRKRCH